MICCRDFAQKCANNYGLKGWVRNTTCGRVSRFPTWLTGWSSEVDSSALLRSREKFRVMSRPCRSLYSRLIKVHVWLMWWSLRSESLSPKMERMAFWWCELQNPCSITPRLEMGFSFGMEVFVISGLITSSSDVVLWWYFWYTLTRIMNFWNLLPSRLPSKLHWEEVFFLTKWFLQSQVSLR